MTKEEKANRNIRLENRAKGHIQGALEELRQAIECLELSGHELYPMHQSAGKLREIRNTLDNCL